MNYKKIQLIALDLDDTTLNERGQLTKRTRNAIVSAINAGIQVVVASGRAYTSLPQDVMSIPGLKYAITSNGAAIYQVDTNTCIHNYKILDTSVREILALQDVYNVVYEVFIDGKAYADKRYVADPTSFGTSERAVAYIQRTREPVENMTDFMLDNIHRFDSIDIVVDSPEKKSEIAKYLAERDKMVYITSSVPYLVEVAYKDAGKGSALRHLCKKLNISLNDCVAFGNGDNDVDMLAVCGMGVAVENSTMACKEVADIVTLSNERNGVACIIEEILNNR